MAILKDLTWTLVPPRIHYYLLLFQYTFLGSLLPGDICRSVEGKTWYIVLRFYDCTLFFPQLFRRMFILFIPWGQRDLFMCIRSSVLVITWGRKFGGRELGCLYYTQLPGKLIERGRGSGPSPGGVNNLEQYLPNSPLTSEFLDYVGSGLVEWPEDERQQADVDRGRCVL